MIAEALARFLPARRMAREPIDDFWYRPVGAVAPSGVDVTPDRAMSVAVVFACLRLLAETIGSLPCLVYRRTGEGDKERAADHPLYRILHDRPNVWQTPQEFWEMVVAHVLLRGNFYALREGSGVEQLVPLNPDPSRMAVEQLDDGTLRYLYRDASGLQVVYRQEEILHIRGLSLNGAIGVSVLEYARNAIGLSTAQETHGASLFANGAMPPFWIKRPPGVKWSGEARANFRAGWRGMHAGSGNAHNPPILEDGMELMALGVSNEDSQWLESRSFQAVEICRFFRVQPHLVGILDRATFSNIEHQGQEFVTYTLTPWLNRIAQAVGRSLLGDDATYFVEFLPDALLRGDTATRYAAYNIGLQAGFLTPNEVRRRENLPPLPGGDELRAPLNMAPADAEADPPEPPAEEEDDAEDEPEPPRERAVDLRPLVADAAARIAAADGEIATARGPQRAADRERWNTWATGRCQEHQPWVARVLRPIFAAAGNAAAADTLAVTLCDGTRIEITETPQIDAMAARWEQTRAALLAAIITEALDHV